MEEAGSRPTPDAPGIPPAVADWCAAHLGGPPVGLLGAPVQQMSTVFGLRLADGRRVALKVRSDEGGRTAICVDLQRSLAAAGFPCPRPLTAALPLGEGVAHAEEWRPGGSMRDDASADHARRSARLLARLMALLATFDPTVPLPNPRWLRWDGTTLWPDAPHLDRRDPRLVPEDVDDVARAVRERLSADTGAVVVGHGDWEAQNLRWNADGTPSVVHDWDSLAARSEAALVGAACGCFASTSVPTLAPLESSEVFLQEYRRFRPLSGDELEVAWAASLWPALWNARGQALVGADPVALTAVREQSAERLRRAGL